MGLFISVAHAAEEAGHEAASSGMPQLAVETYPSQIFWLVVSLVVLYFVLSRVALPRVAGAIESRHDAVEDDLDRAGEFKRKAEEAEAAYEAALASARAKAQEIAAETRAGIQKDLDAAIAKADAEISAKASESEARIKEIRASAMEAVEEVAQETADAIIAAVMPGATKSGAVKAAVASRLKG
jgi:F-type H+-transporting ATPase subunit b